MNFSKGQVVNGGMLLRGWMLYDLMDEWMEKNVDQSLYTMRALC
jgi:hypothetical protein